jgi:hypothetical protein
MHGRDQQKGGAPLTGSVARLVGGRQMGIGNLFKKTILKKKNGIKRKKTS